MTVGDARAVRPTEGRPVERRAPDFGADFRRCRRRFDGLAEAIKAVLGREPRHRDAGHLVAAALDADARPFRAQRHERVRPGRLEPTAPVHQPRLPEREDHPATAVALVCADEFLPRPAIIRRRGGERLGAGLLQGLLQFFVFRRGRRIERGIQGVLAHGAVLENLPDHRLVALARGREERYVHILGAGLDQNLRRRQLFAADGGTQRRGVPDAVAGVDIGAALDQELDHVEFVSAGRNPQRGDADLILGVDVSPVVEGGGHGFHIPRPHRRPQSLAFLVACAGRRGQKCQRRNQSQNRPRTILEHAEPR